MLNFLKNFSTSIERDHMIVIFNPVNIIYHNDLQKLNHIILWDKPHFFDQDNAFFNVLLNLGC